MKKIMSVAQARSDAIIKIGSLMVSFSIYLSCKCLRTGNCVIDDEEEEEKEEGEEKNTFHLTCLLCLISFHFPLLLLSFLAPLPWSPSVSSFPSQFSTTAPPLLLLPFLRLASFRSSQGNNPRRGRNSFQVT